MNLKSQKTSELLTANAAFHTRQFAEEFRKQTQAEEALRRLQEKPLTFLHRIVPGQMSKLSKEMGKKNG